MLRRFQTIAQMNDRIRNALRVIECPMYAKSGYRVCPNISESSAGSIFVRLAMHPALAQALQEWRRESSYSKDNDWIFASAHAKGKIPRSAGVAGQDYLRPAAVKAGVIPKGYKGRFGWHNLRHSLGTFLAANEVNLPVIQSMLRHSRPSTSSVYLHRVNSAQMAAQEKFLDAIKVTSAAG